MGEDTEHEAGVVERPPASADTNTNTNTASSEAVAAVVPRRRRNRRSLNSKASNLCGSIRNKVEQEKIFEQLLQLQKRIQAAPQNKQSKQVVEALSRIQEVNSQNESLIQHLQEQLRKVTLERDAACRVANQLEKDIHKERLGFAKVSFKHTKKIDKLARKCKGMSEELKEKEDAIKLFEVNRVIGKLDGREDASTASTEPPSDASQDTTTTPVDVTIEGTDVAPSSPASSQDRRVDEMIRYWRDKYEKSEGQNEELIEMISKVSDENNQLIEENEQLFTSMIQLGGCLSFYKRSLSDGSRSLEEDDLPPTLCEVPALTEEDVKQSVDGLVASLCDSSHAVKDEDDELKPGTVKSSEEEYDAAKRQGTIELSSEDVDEYYKELIASKLKEYEQCDFSPVPLSPICEENDDEDECKVKEDQPTKRSMARAA